MEINRNNIIEKGLTSLTEICLFSNQIQSIDKDTFKDLNYLTIIDLSWNQIKSIHQDTFQGLTNLTKINLWENQIESIHQDTFKGLNSLTKINEVTTEDRFKKRVILQEYLIELEEVEGLKLIKLDSIKKSYYFHLEIKSNYNFTPILLYENEEKNSNFSEVKI